jgi:hypothetical protein
MPKTTLESKIKKKKAQAYDKLRELEEMQLGFNKMMQQKQAEFQAEFAVKKRELQILNEQIFKWEQPEDYAKIMEMRKKQALDAAKPTAPKQPLS